MVINNAGIMNNYKLLETDPCLIESTLKINVHPQFYMAKYAVKHFIKANDDYETKKALVFISSIITMFDMPTTMVYSGTKTSNLVFSQM